MAINTNRLRRRSALLPLLFMLGAAPTLRAVIVHGSVTDSLGHPIPNAVVALVDNGQVIATVRSGQDGSYQLSSGTTGRFYVLAGGNYFRQLMTESFYGGTLDSLEKNVQLEPETVRQSIVVTATGSPTPLAQVSASITRLGSTDFQTFDNVTDALRTVPGFQLVQSGGRGAATSLFIRGGNSDANKVLLDGVPLEDIGGTFDFANLANTGIASAEAYRGPNSVLFGADAGAGVVAFATPRGSTPFPSLIYDGDGGNFGTYRNQVQGGGTQNKFDYYGGFSDLQTRNATQYDSYHDVTSSANLGYALSAATSLRVTARNSDSATGSPGQYQFTRIASDAKQADQNIFLSGVLDHTFSDRWKGYVQYGLARKREQYTSLAATGIFDPVSQNYFGQNVTVTGANNFTVTGQTIVSYAGSTYPYTSDSASNRDTGYAQTTYAISPHATALAGFRYEDERGNYYGTSVERANYDYTLEFHGDIASRFFYTLGGGVEKNQLFGTVGAPHLGASYYLVKPGAGLLQGTRLNFNFSKGYKEPTLGQQTGSLYAFLLANGGSPVVNQFQVRPIAAALTRSYDGGLVQSVWNERILLKLTYFHNEFGNQIESVGPAAIPQLLPQLSAAQQASLESYLQVADQYGYGIDLNSLAFRAQGAESEIEYGLGKRVFLRGGYTYLDAKVQRSFSSDALGPSYNTSSNFGALAIGNDAPLVGARPFRRAPHGGFIAGTYTAGKWTAVASGSFSSRSDDSTYLGGYDVNGGNSLLLPNRNLDFGYARLDLSATYNIKPYAGVYTQLDNLLSQQHSSPVGYLSEPFTVRTGVKLTLGKGVK